MPDGQESVFYLAACRESWKNMFNWFTKPAAPPPTAVEPAVTPPPSPRLGWRLGLLGKRLQHLAAHALNTEKAFSANLIEVDARTAAMSGAISQTRSQMIDSVREADGLRLRSLAEMEGVRSALQAELDRLQGRLDEKVGQIDEVVGVLQQIGKSLELLALNAAIQAASAGEAGRSFIVVSDHIRKLAQDTVANAKRASSLLDFGEFLDQLGDFKATSLHHVDGANAVAASAFATIAQGFDALSTSLDRLEGHSRVVGAMHATSQAIFDRQRGKIEWMGQLAAQQAAFAAADDTALDGALQQLCRSEGLASDPGFDRLAEIRRRGVLRVAIEPAFKGLSFRKRPGDRLCGLDVDYATAFAKHLGVRIEFVEYPWDQCTELLHAGTKRGNQEADLVWSALPPNPAWQGVAFSETYTWLRYVLARRVGDTAIEGVASLAGKVLGCINDPAALATLEAAGLRWGKHTRNEPGTVRLANLISYSDQSLIHDALADGVVDAFAVDQPIFAWACYGSDSPWRGRIEILPQNLAASLWYYAVGVADAPSSAQLLAEVNRFLAAFLNTRERQEIEQRWQIEPVQGRENFRLESGGLRGEAELLADWTALQAQL